MPPENANTDNTEIKKLPPAESIVGFAPDVDGRGAEVRLDFFPTRYEVHELVRHWSRAALERDFFAYLTGSVSSDDTKIVQYADRRLAQLAAVLGDFETRRVVDQVRSELQSQFGDFVWEAFTNDIALERDMFLDGP